MQKAEKVIFGKEVNLTLFFDEEGTFYSRNNNISDVLQVRSVFQDSDNLDDVNADIPNSATKCYRMENKVSDHRRACRSANVRIRFVRSWNSSISKCLGIMFSSNLMFITHVKRLET